ncbi:MAG: YcfL family protein [Campylobacteraceae bacterium]|jgi:uncharacterized protein YcfL|nr:YcfL family protein [Campylobacteraceae bacterium]
MKGVLYIVLGVGLFLFTGCTQVRQLWQDLGLGPQPQQQQPQEQLQRPQIALVQKSYQDVIFEDDIVKDWLILDSFTAKKRNDKLIELELIGINRLSSAKQFTYRIDWYDEDGLVIKSILSKWKIISVEGGRNVVIRAISPRENAAAYKIRVGTPSQEDELRDKNTNLKEYQGE